MNGYAESGIDVGKYDNSYAYVTDMMEADITAVRVAQALGDYTANEASLVTHYIEKYLAAIMKGF